MQTPSSAMTTDRFTTDGSAFLRCSNHLSVHVQSSSSASTHVMLRISSTIVHSIVSVSTPVCQATRISLSHVCFTLNHCPLPLRYGHTLSVSHVCSHGISVYSSLRYGQTLSLSHVCFTLNQCHMSVQTESLSTPVKVRTHVISVTCLFTRNQRLLLFKVRTDVIIVTCLFFTESMSYVCSHRISVHST